MTRLRLLLFFVIVFQFFCIDYVSAYPVQPLGNKVRVTTRASDKQVWGLSNDHKLLHLIQDKAGTWTWINSIRPDGLSLQARPHSLAADKEGHVFVLWKNDKGFAISKHKDDEAMIISAFETNFENFERTTAFSESAGLFIDSKQRLWVTHAAPSVYILSPSGTMLANYKIGREFFIRDAECGAIADWSPVQTTEAPNGAIFLWSLTATLRNRLYFPGIIRVDDLSFKHLLEASDGKAITYLGLHDDSSLYLLTRPETIYSYALDSGKKTLLPFLPAAKYNFPILARNIRGTEFVVMLTEFYDDLQAAGDLYALKNGAYSRILRGLDGGIPHWKAHQRPFFDLDQIILVGSFGKGLFAIERATLKVVNISQNFEGLPKGIDGLQAIDNSVLVSSEDEESVILKIKDLRNAAQEALSASR